MSEILGHWFRMCSKFAIMVVSNVFVKLPYGDSWGVCTDCIDTQESLLE